MRVVKIEVQFGLVESMRYDNVRAQVNLTADVDSEYEDTDNCIADLTAQARAHVELAVDEQLMAKDVSPRYYEGTLWGLWLQMESKLILFCPMGMCPDGWFREIRGNFPYDNVREYLLRKVLPEYGGWLVIEFETGKEARGEWRARYEALCQERVAQFIDDAEERGEEEPDEEEPDEEGWDAPNWEPPSIELDDYQVDPNA